MAYIVFSVLGVMLCIFLNLLVIIVLLRKTDAINRLDLLMISLAISDILRAVVGHSLEINSVHRGSSISDQECQIIGFATTFLGLVSISHLTGIAIQRHAILQSPITARAWITDTRIAWYVVIPSWLYGLFWSLAPLLGWSSYRPMSQESNLCGPLLNINSYENATGEYAASYLVSLSVFCFIIPISIISACCYFIYQSLKHMRQVSGLLGLSLAIHLARQKLEEKQCIMGAVIIGAFLVAWSPYAVCVLIAAAGGTISSTLLLTSAVFGKTSCLFNPIIYSFFVKDFRSKCQDMLQWKFLRTLIPALLSADSSIKDNRKENLGQNHSNVISTEV